ncbi:unnamed protein product [Blepharisma stoltei]|uniref:Uncharacterized protein n=1 Tax=Blepharisma stoltei TaxID=1481888 RepID=A0AAU9IF32_9CILI|nr:unnamed protein product [Blepharisma stoltei]
METISNTLDIPEGELENCLSFVRSIKKFLKESAKAHSKLSSAYSSLLSKYQTPFLPEYNKIIKIHKEIISGIMTSNKERIDTAQNGHDDLKVLSSEIKQHIRNIKQNKKYLVSLTKLSDQAIHSKSYKSYKLCAQPLIDSPDKHIVKHSKQSIEYSSGLSSSIENQVNILKQKILNEAKRVIKTQKSCERKKRSKSSNLDLGDITSKKIEIKYSKVNNTLRVSSVSPVKRNEEWSDKQNEFDNINTEMRNSKPSTPAKPPVHPKRINSEPSSAPLKHFNGSPLRLNFQEKIKIEDSNVNDDKKEISDFSSRIYTETQENKENIFN